MIYETGNVILTAGAASANSDWYLMSRTLPVSATLRVTSSAASLVGSLTFLVTDFDQKSGFEDVANVFTTGALPSGVTFANGVLSLASPASGTFEVSFTAVGVPRWLRAAWTYTSGGGSVSVAVALSGWGVG